MDTKSAPTKLSFSVHTRDRKGRLESDQSTAIQMVKISLVIVQLAKCAVKSYCKCAVGVSHFLQNVHVVYISCEVPSALAGLAHASAVLCLLCWLVLLICPLLFVSRVLIVPELFAFAFAFI